MMNTRSRSATPDLVPDSENRRREDRGFRNRRVNPWTATLAILSTPIIYGILSWGAAALPRFVTERRFVADSLHRDALEARRDSALFRIDSRVGDWYCSTVPADKRGGCR